MRETSWELTEMRELLELSEPASRAETLSSATSEMMSVRGSESTTRAISAAVESGKCSVTRYSPLATRHGTLSSIGSRSSSRSGGILKRCEASLVALHPPNDETAPRASLRRSARGATHLHSPTRPERTKERAAGVRTGSRRAGVGPRCPRSWRACRVSRRRHDRQPSRQARRRSNGRRCEGRRALLREWLRLFRRCSSHAGQRRPVALPYRLDEQAVHMDRRHAVGRAGKARPRHGREQVPRLQDSRHLSEAADHAASHHDPHAGLRGGWARPHHRRLDEDDSVGPLARDAYPGTRAPTRHVLVLLEL